MRYIHHFVFMVQIYEIIVKQKYIIFKNKQLLCNSLFFLKNHPVLSYFLRTLNIKKSASIMRRILLMISFLLPDDFPVGDFTALTNF